ncbi:hypothetical protein P308_21965 [Pseudomonas piscis]|nr:hypothetical protein P308_21965 [Pseudomonas piscis]
MRYSAGHKQETRERLLQSSSVQAKDEGFSTVGVDALMKAIGLSGGAFYSHFASKDELFGSIVERELRQSLERLAGNGQHDREKLRRCLKQYLSMAHVQQPGAGCALPALGAEISRGPEEVRQRAEILSIDYTRPGRKRWAARAWPGRSWRNAWGPWWWRGCW